MANFFHSNKVHQIKRIQPVLLASYDKATTKDRLAIGTQGIGSGVRRNQPGFPLGSVRQKTPQMMELHDDDEVDDDDSEYEDDESHEDNEGSVDL